jgi:hypothetical protein
MAQRLIERYQVGDLVEITFDDVHWQPATVRQQQHPGLWVQTTDGRIWYVTNTQHIRKSVTQ